MSAWEDEKNIELLKQLWAKGMSCSQIATRIGGISRNAVIGKVSRLGLPSRIRTSSVKRKGSRKSWPRKPHFANVGNPALRQLYLGDAEPYTPPAEELVIPLNERKSIQTLTEACCRWPIGDPQLADFHFCGRKKVTGLPYCEFHARRAYQPPQPLSRRRVPASAPAIVVKEDA